jgi:putative phosphoribosyl transferase
MSRHTIEDARSVRITSGAAMLEGDLVAPVDAGGIVLFAHGSGSSRHSARNRFVARELQGAGLATLLFDLLTADEEALDAETGHLRFDIELLAERLLDATTWVRGESQLQTLPIGYFGASTGGGAALVAAARRPDTVAAVVSRGGRPDLAGDSLPLVRAPTLLIVGARDHQVLRLNEAAMRRMRSEVGLEVVPGATHLFEEAGALETVARLARDWFRLHLVSSERER